tara:strand:- start:1948 stop:5877 length:3930 start_codon:yes stop_codon:yes gene_type:complete
MARQPTPMVPVRYDTVLPASRDQMSRDVNAANMLSQLNDPEAFLGFGGPRTSVLPSIARIAETPAQEAERRAQAGDFAKGIGLGLTTDIVGLAGDLPALLLSDAPKFAAALAMGKSFDEMPSTVLDEGLNAIRDTIGSDALAGYLGVDADTLAKPGVTTGRLLSSIVDPVVIGGAIKGLLKAKSGRAAKREEATRNQRQALVRLTNSLTVGDEGIGTLIPTARAEDVDADALAAIMPDEMPTVDEVIGNHTYEVDQFNNPLQRQQFGAMTEDELLRQATSRQADIDGARQRLNEALADPDVTDEARIIAEGDVISHENYLRQIQNELIGRRDGHITQLTQDEVDALPMPEEFEPPAALMDQIGEAIDQAAFSRGVPEEVSQDELVPLDVTDTNGNPIPEGTFAGQPGGIGALDEAAPVYGLKGVRIGASPDEYLGTVDHTSPTMANFYNFMGHNNGKTYAKRAAKDGTMTGDQWLSALRQNAANRQNIKAVGPEIKNSEFERILTESKDKRFSAEDVRRLLTTRLPQTRSRVYLESRFGGGTAETAPFGSRGPFHLSSQYRQEDLDAAIDKGVLIFSNTAPTIDVPGFGRQKPRAVHDYYGDYPGYYGHVRFIIVEGVDGKRYLQLNEIQSNSVSNLASGFKSGKTINDRGEEVNFYRKTLEDRLDGFAGRGESAVNESIRVPYTPEVHGLMQKYQDLMPESMKREKSLSKEIDQLEKTNTRLEREYATTHLPSRQLDESGETGTKLKYANTILSMASDPNIMARLVARAEDLGEYVGDATTRARSEIQTNISDHLDALGEIASPDQIEHILDLMTTVARRVKEASEGNMPMLYSRVMKQRITGSNDPFPRTREINDRLESLSPDQLASVLIRDRIIDDIAGAETIKMQAILSNNPKFRDAVTSLTPDELDLVNDGLRAREPVVESIFNKFTDADKAEILDELDQFYQSEITDQIAFGAANELKPERVLRLDNDEFFKDNINSLLALELDGLMNEFNIAKNNQKLVQLTEELANNMPAATRDKDPFDQTIANDPDGQKMLTLQDVAAKTETTNGQKGFQAPEPYDNEDDFTRFAVRSIMQEAEKLGLDGVIFPDANYLATQPQRMGGRPEQIVASDPFIRRYGKILDEELKELSKANQNAGVSVYDEGYDILPEYRREGAFTVNAIDRNNFGNLEILQPLEEAEAAAKKAKKEAYARLSDSQKQNYVIRKSLPNSNDVDFFESIPDQDAYYLQPYVAASEALALAEAQLRQVKRGLVQEYKAPIRVVEFGGPNDGLQAEANRQVVRRPIRRAAGGMVRSGIGSMAREVM